MFQFCFHIRIFSQVSPWNPRIGAIHLFWISHLLQILNLPHHTDGRREDCSYRTSSLRTRWWAHRTPNVCTIHFLGQVLWMNHTAFRDQQLDWSVHWCYSVWQETWFTNGISNWKMSTCTYHCLKVYQQSCSIALSSHSIWKSASKETLLISMYV